MDYSLTSRMVSWQLLGAITYSLVLQKIATFFEEHRRLTYILSHCCTVIAMIAVAAGGYTSYQNWQYNTRQQVVITHAVAKANRGTPSKSQPKPLTPDSAPSTVQPSIDTVKNYQVAPDMPQYLSIPKLGIHARILSVELSTDGSIATPDNVFDAAWYDQSARPGEPGTAFIDGHISSWTSQGVFYNLNKLTNGDVVEIQRGDGHIFKYVVERTAVYEANNIDMSQVLSPLDATKPRLNLMSCYGSVINGTNEFDHRIVIYTSLSS